MNNLWAFLEWLRDPFGSKKLTERHDGIRRRMIETKIRAEDTTKLVRRFPVRRHVRRNPIEKVVLGNRSLRAASARTSEGGSRPRMNHVAHSAVEDGPP